MSTDGQAYENLYQRILRFLEELPPTPSTHDVRTGLLRLADMARARNDLPQLQKLHRETQLLAESLRRAAAHDRSGQQSNPRLARVTCVDAGPGLRSWGQPPRRIASWSWRRDHAPIRYPYGDPPTSPHHASSDTTHCMPDSKLSADCLARVKAYRRSIAERQAGEAEARECHGQVRYHGADEPPEWVWPDVPE